MIRALSLLFGLALVLAAPAAFGQVQTMVKTPPLQNSDTFSPFISIHNTAPGGPGTPVNPPWVGWAGAIMSIHLIDNTELDVDAFHPVMAGRTTGPLGSPVFFPASTLIVSPLGPRSMNVASSPRQLTFWDPSAQGSGITIFGSQNLRLGTAQFHVKGSSPAGNSDVDLTAMFWNIWHVRNVQGSTLIHLDPSDFVWVPSQFNSQNQLHTSMSFYRFPPPPHVSTMAPTAHWLHITQPATFHLSQFDASIFYATFLNTATLGIEHVPEPASAALIGLGLTALAARRTIRRQRLAAA